jgi:hypothetical protein
VLAACDGPLLEEEIGGNRRFLEEKLQIRSEHFAIPFGKKEHYSAESLAVLANHGYTHVYSSNPSHVAADSAPLIPRIGVTDERPGALFFNVNRPLLKRVEI